MIYLSGQPLSLKQIADVAYGREGVSLSDHARVRVNAARSVVERIVAEGRTVYGVNTRLWQSYRTLVSSRQSCATCNLTWCVVIRADSAELSQRPRPGRCGVVARANVLAAGFSGARPLVIGHADRNA